LSNSDSGGGGLPERLIILVVSSSSSAARSSAEDEERKRIWEKVAEGEGGFNSTWSDSSAECESDLKDERLWGKRQRLGNGECVWLCRCEWGLRGK